MLLPDYVIKWVQRALNRNKGSLYFYRWANAKCNYKVHEQANRTRNMKKIEKTLKLAWNLTELHRLPQSHDQAATLLQPRRNPRRHDCKHVRGTCSDADEKISLGNSVKTCMRTLKLRRTQQRKKLFKMTVTINCVRPYWCTLCLQHTILPRIREWSGFEEPTTCVRVWGLPTYASGALLKVFKYISS